ncbi:MAG: prepilin peptidase, partial [Abitibacteriaceae bacterium]|nr:prepilin peptidase [Abditibacteriaceae bacterium]
MFNTLKFLIMGYYFSKFTGAEAAHLSPSAVLIINGVLIALLLTSAITDTRQGKILNVVTFPAMLAGLLLNGIFGSTTGFVWALIGWCVGMAIQWVPFMLGFAKAGDVKLLAAVGALKGWAFCLFGFLYGAAAFGFLLLPWLARRGELGMVGQNIRNYFTTAAITQAVPNTPAPTVTKRFVPWGVGLAIGFFIALGLEIALGRPL